MILELDIGNSLIKWRQIHEQDRRVLNAGVVTDVSALQDALNGDAMPVMIRLCSVRNTRAVELLRDWAAESWGLAISSATVTKTCGGVSNHYANPSKLGVDRWMAMLAAFRRADGACVIVDCGTALTIDVVDAKGSHLGGYILPGLGMMRASLEANTNIELLERPAQQTTRQSLSLGHSTDEAVCNGTLAAGVALIEHVINAELVGVEKLSLYFTGGDADAVAASVTTHSGEVIPGLVLDGLAVACPYPVERP